MKKSKPQVRKRNHRDDNKSTRRPQRRAPIIPGHENETWYGLKKKGLLDRYCQNGEGEYIPAFAKPEYNGPLDITPCKICARPHWSHCEFPQNGSDVVAVSNNPDDEADVACMDDNEEGDINNAEKERGGDTEKDDDDDDNSLPPEMKKQKTDIVQSPAEIEFGAQSISESGRILCEHYLSPIVVDGTAAKIFDEISPGLKLVGRSFPTVSHLMSSLRCSDTAQAIRFTTSGDIGVVEESDVEKLLLRIYPGDGAWVKRSAATICRKKIHGVLAISVMKHPLDIGLSAENTARVNENERTAYLHALRLKFSQNAAHRAVLMDTGTATLIETTGVDDHWGAHREKDGWVGDNISGNCLMEVRTTLRGDRK